MMAANVVVAKKASDPRILDIRELATFADYFVICHGLSHRQNLAIAEDFNHTPIPSDQPIIATTAGETAGEESYFA